jgi:lathosterol oxidase
MALGGGLGMSFGIGGALELLYYRRRRHEPERWKLQPRRWPPASARRSELLLGTLNMTAGSIVSGLIVYHIARGGYTTVYFGLEPGGLPAALALTALYFFGTDLALYWAHRIFHRPKLLRYIHRWHHRYTSPTAFTAAASHPVEFATYQAIALLPVFFLPLPAAGVIATLIYQNYVALIDHSGIDLRPILPRPPARFHDDHHVYFHVNYGQNLGLWDRLFGTWRREGRRYGVDVFGGRGAPDDAGEPRKPIYIRYPGRWASEAGTPGGEPPPPRAGVAGPGREGR